MASPQDNHIEGSAFAFEQIHVIAKPDPTIPNRIRDLLDRIVTRPSWQLDLTEDPGDGAAFARQAIDAGTDLLVVYGGDGTLNDVIQGAAHSTTPVFVIPGGTGNLIASELGIPGAPETALALVNEPELFQHPIDLGFRDQEHYFALRCGCGLEAAALVETDSDSKTRLGKWAYALGFFKALTKFSSNHYRLTLNGRSREEECVAVSIGNASRLGIGDLTLSSQASITDGLLDVVLFRPEAIASIVDFLLLSTKENPPDLDSDNLIAVEQVTSVHIETDYPVQVQMDGELSGQPPLDIQVSPAALQVAVPNNKQL